MTLIMTRRMSPLIALILVPIVFGLLSGFALRLGPMMLEGYAARKQQPVDLTFGGMGFTGYTGIFGLRVSGGLNVGRGNGTEQTATYDYSTCTVGPCQIRTVNSNYSGGSGLYLGGWTADADVLLEPFRRVPVMKSLLLGFSPYGFFGIGGYGLRPRGAPDTSIATLSYGLGAHHDLLAWLGVGVSVDDREVFFAFEHCS